MNLAQMRDVNDSIIRAPCLPRIGDSVQFALMLWLSAGLWVGLGIMVNFSHARFAWKTFVLQPWVLKFLR